MSNNGGAMKKAVLGNDPFAKKAIRERVEDVLMPTIMKEPDARTLHQSEESVLFELIDRRIDERLTSIESKIEHSLESFEERLAKKLEKTGVTDAAKTFEKDFESLLKVMEERIKDSLKDMPLAEKIERSSATHDLFSILRANKNLFTFDFYRSKFRTLRMLGRSDIVDDFGMDLVFLDLIEPIFDFVYDKYWRVEVHNIRQVPSTGRALIVSNHSGALPYDAAMVGLSVLREHPARRNVRPLIEDFAFYLPFVSSFMAKIGGVRACQENAQMLLERDELVIVFPEGVKGTGKPFSKRYHLQRFGRGGFVRLCINTGSPIVPVSVVGAEEVQPIIGNLKYLARLMKVPYFPITPTFPLLGLIGMMPYPAKIFIDFCEPIDIAHYGKEMIHDDIFVSQMSEKVRSIIQQSIIERLKKRKSVFFG